MNVTPWAPAPAPGLVFILRFGWKTALLIALWIAFSVGAQSGFKYLYVLFLPRHSAFAKLARSIAQLVRMSLGVAGGIT